MEERVATKLSKAAAGSAGLEESPASPASEETEPRTQPPPEYINSNNDQQEEEAGCPPPLSSEYIQLALANGPVSNGYIQIQQLPKNVLPGTATATTITTITTTTSSNLKPELDSRSVALVDSGLQSPGYSQVGLLKAESSPPVCPSAGYIQFPSNSVLISPGLLEQNSDPRTFQLRNTIV